MAADTEYKGTREDRISVKEYVLGYEMFNWNTTPNYEALNETTTRI